MIFKKKHQTEENEPAEDTSYNNEEETGDNDKDIKDNTEDTEELSDDSSHDNVAEKASAAEEDEDRYDEASYEDDDDEGETIPVKPAKAVKKIRKRSSAEKISFIVLDWLISVIVACIPVAGIIYLIIKGIIKKDNSEKSTWARQMFIVEVILYAALFIMLGRRTSFKFNLPSGTEKRTEELKDTDKKGSKEGSDTVTAKFGNGAAVQLTSDDKKYSLSNEKNDKITQMKTYTSSDNLYTIMVICMPDSEVMKNAVSEDYIEAQKGTDETISDYKEQANDEFTMCSYTSENSGITSYKYVFYGKKGDYIKVTSDEKLTTAARYIKNSNKR